MIRTRADTLGAISGVCSWLLSACVWLERVRGRSGGFRGWPHLPFRRTDGTGRSFGTTPTLTRQRRVSGWRRTSAVPHRFVNCRGTRIGVALSHGPATADRSRSWYKTLGSWWWTLRLDVSGWTGGSCPRTGIRRRGRSGASPFRRTDRRRGSKRAVAAPTRVPIGSKAWESEQPV